MWSRNKYLEEFARLFMRLGEADCILEGKLHHDPQLKESCIELIEKEFVKISRLFTPYRLYDDLLYNLLDELENDFYRYPDERYAYLRDIILCFGSIIPLIEKYINKQHFIAHLHSFRTEYATHFKAYYPNYQASNEKLIWGVSVAERYVVCCVSVMDKFSTFLDAKCMNFNIDLGEIQRDLNTYLFRNRNFTSLDIMGYSNKVNSIWCISPTFEQKNGYPLPNFNQAYSNYIQINPVQAQKAIDTQKQQETTTTVVTTAATKSETEKVEKKIEVNAFCASMSFDIPKNHFKILKEKKNSNGEPFLTEAQFNAFINKAFYGKAGIPKQKLNYSKGERLLLQALFYDFYSDCCVDYFNTMQCRDQFIRLLTENFDGWDFARVKANFKPKNDKRL